LNPADTWGTGAQRRREKMKDNEIGEIKGKYLAQKNGAIN